MAKKSLGGQVLKKKSTLLSVAGLSQSFQNEVTPQIAEEVNVEELPPQIQEKLVYLKDEELIDDPLNKEYYGELEVHNLAEAMMQYGFQGVILAYPVDGDKYMIESGHRRRLAGRRAGITEFPVFITKKPEHEWERTLRLIGANLHNRPDLSPISIAKQAQLLFKAHEEEIKYKKKNGLLKEGETFLLNELVGQDFEMTSKNVEKYRRLLNLIPELQEIVDSKRVPWSYLSEASNLPEAMQYQLKNMIEEKGECSSFEWLKKIIKKMKKGEVIEPSQEKKPGAEITRSQILVKSIQKIQGILEEEIQVDEDNYEEVLNSLENLQIKIKEQIDKIKK